MVGRPSRWACRQEREISSSIHLRTVGTVVAKSRAVSLMPRSRALSTRRSRWLQGFFISRTDQNTGGSCHDAAILPAAHCRKAVERPGLGNRSAISTFPPQPQQIQLLPVLLAQTLQTSPGGYNVTGLFQRRGGLD